MTYDAGVVFVFSAELVIRFVFREITIKIRQSFYWNAVSVTQRLPKMIATITRRVRALTILGEKIIDNDNFNDTR